MYKILTVLAFCLTATLFATQKPNQNSTTCCECKPLYFSDCECIRVTPAAGPRIARSWNFILAADFIYWTVRQDGMFHAVSGVGSNVSKGKVYDLNWQWEPGFKVGLGSNLPHDCWDLYAEYTWIRSNVSHSTSVSNLVSYWSIGGVPLLALLDSHANWRIRFHDLHLELGRNSYLSQYLKLRVHVGLQGSWIDQKYRIRQTLLEDNAVNRLFLGQDFWGVGLRAGLNTAWQFTRSFSFYGDLALAILWGQFDLDRKDQTTTAINVTTTTINTGVSPHTFEPVVSLGAGFRWETWFGMNDCCMEQFHISFEAGWEHQLWILQNELIKVPTETDHIGDLILQGLTVKVRFDF